MGIVDNLYRMKVIIKYQHGICKYKEKVRQVCELTPLFYIHIFKIPDHVIGHIAHSASKEPRQALVYNRFVVRHLFLYSIERVFAGLSRYNPIPHPCNSPLVCPYYDPGVTAKETIPGPFLPPLDTLEKERIITFIYLYERRDRRFKVGKYLFINRYKIPLLRLFAEFFKGWVVHDRPIKLT